MENIFAAHKTSKTRTTHAKAFEQISNKKRKFNEWKTFWSTQNNSKGSNWKLSSFKGKREDYVFNLLRKIRGKVLWLMDEGGRVHLPDVAVAKKNFSFQTRHFISKFWSWIKKDKMGCHLKKKMVHWDISILSIWAEALQCIPKRLTEIP